MFPALDQLPIPLFRTAGDRRLTWVNGAWEQAVRIPIGTPWFDPFTGIDEPEAIRLWQRCVEALQPVTLSTAACLPDGENRFYELILQPAVVDGTSEMMGSLVDVTEQTVALAETRAILDTAVDGIIIIDEHGRIETVNPAACSLFGYTAETLIGTSVNRLMNPQDQVRHDGYLAHYVATGEATVIGKGREVTGRTAAGDPIPLYLAVSDIRLDGRRRFAGILRNLTEQHAAREALASQREKLAHVGRLSTMGEMTASIAHEINQPLTAIAMYAQAGLKLLEREDSTEKVRSALDKLNTQSLRAGAVIERIQRFARAQETARELVAINELVTDLLKLADSDARMHGIELELSLADGLPPLFADPVQIQQVVLNLIRNGIDAMNEIGCRHGHTIRIRTRLVGDSVELSVVDQGSGVAEDQFELVFTPFHTTKQEGMGMGLSICRTIITEHGGELDFRNNDGPGACFYFRLPVDND